MAILNSAPMDARALTTRKSAASMPDREYASSAKRNSRPVPEQAGAQTRSSALVTIAYASIACVAERDSREPGSHSSTRKRQLGNKIRSRSGPCDGKAHHSVHDLPWHQAAGTSRAHAVA